MFDFEAKILFLYTKSVYTRLNIEPTCLYAFPFQITNEYTRMWPDYTSGDYTAYIYWKKEGLSLFYYATSTYDRMAI